MYSELPYKRRHLSRDAHDAQEIRRFQGSTALQKTGLTAILRTTKIQSRRQYSLFSLTQNPWLWSYHTMQGVELARGVL